MEKNKSKKPKKNLFIRILKWSGLTIVSILLIVVLILSIIGVPKPGTITAQGISRVPWKLAYDMYGVMKKGAQSSSIISWSSNENGMIIMAHSGGMNRKPHYLPKPDTNPEIIENLPERISSISLNPNPKENYMVFLMDIGGNELYELFRYDFSNKTYQQITHFKSQIGAGYFNSDGSLYTFRSNKRNGKDFDIYMMNPKDTTSIKMICETDGYWFPGQWSENSETILITQYVSVNEAHINLVNLKTLDKQEIFPNSSDKVSYSDAVWGKNDSTLFYLSDDQSEFKELHRLNLHTQEDTILTKSIHWDIVTIKRSVDANWIVLEVNEDGYGMLLLLDCNSLKIEKIKNIPIGLIGSMKMHPKQNIFAFDHISTSTISSVYSFNMDTKELISWTQKPVEKNPLPHPETIHYQTFDSIDGKARTITAYVMRPDKSFTGPRPVWLDIHGGPEAQALPIMSPRHEMARRNGITVIFPNVRGSVGYGKSFLKLDNGYLRENSVKDIGALLDWIGKQDSLDSKRVGVIGGSYGGYMVLASAVQYSDRLCCGVDFFGISNYVSFLENTKAYRRDIRRAEYGDERDSEMRKFLSKISTLNNS